jgi:cytosine/adenosine deaminase-related metal-dependent hydrolase
MRKNTLVRARWIVTGTGRDDVVLENAALRIENGKIAELGGWSDLRAHHPDASVLGGPGCAVIPGLINAHHHANGATQQQLGLMDDFLEPWILGFARLRQGKGRHATLLSAARMLRSGVTTVVDVHSGGGTTRDYAAGIEAALLAYRDAGMRVAFAPGLSTRCRLVHGDADADAAFLAGLPAELAARAARCFMPAPGDLDEDEYFGIVETAIGRYRDHDRIDVWFGPPGPQWVGDACLVRVAERAAMLDTRIQTHLVESYYEKLLGPRIWNRATLHHLDELGVLGPRFTMAHGTWLTATEIALLAECGAAVSHNPGSNLRLRAGIAPLNALLGAGATVGIGLDGTTLNDDDDMFTEMRLALRLQRGPALGDPAPTPRDVFAMATTGGARLLGKENRLGRLAPGYDADLAILDLARILAPWVAPEVDPLELIVLRAGAQDVRSVLIAGDLVYDGGRVLGFDADAVARELADMLAAQPFPAAAAATVADLLPHIVAYYRGWEHPEHRPYTRYNARD